jgi:hypothetical protein
VFLSAANGLRRSCFKKPADSHQYTLRQTKDALMDLWISELRALPEWEDRLEAQQQLLKAGVVFPMAGSYARSPRAGRSLATR